MCLSPILIKNPYKDRGLSFDGKHVDFGGRFDYLHDTISQYVSVPCGKCQQCVSLRQSFYNQRIQMEHLRSELFFFTLTYAERGLMVTNIGDYHIAYPNYKDIQNLFKRLRKILPHSIRIMVVSEYGKRKKRPHFHGYIAVSRDDIKKYYRNSVLYCEKVLFKEVLANWKRNISKSHKHPVYVNLCDFVYYNGRSNFDLHWVQPIRNHDNDVSFYLTKYILKYDERTEKLLHKIKYDASLDDEQTKELTSLIKPRCVMSKDFGDWKLPEVQMYIQKCVSRDSDLPQFYDVYTGVSSLLSRYYRRLVDLEYYQERYWNYLKKVQRFTDCYSSYNPELLDDGTALDKQHNSERVASVQKRFSKIKHCIYKKY